MGRAGRPHKVSPSMLDLAALSFPAIDPVALPLGPLKVRWYGLAYMAGLLLAWLYMRRLLARERLWRPAAAPMAPEKVDDFILWATLGVVLGGRLGFALFYQPGLFLADPLRLFSVWEGGMSFHGGLLGVVVATWLFARLNSAPLLSLADTVAAATPFGLFFGRCANFINGEIYGTPTAMPWGVVFPKRVLDPGDAVVPRHPVQLYEAALEGIVLFVVLRWLTHSAGGLQRPGLVSGTFLAGYAAARIFAEFFKEWDGARAMPVTWLSAGMAYSLPMLVLGGWLIWRARHPAAGAGTAR